MNFAKIKYLSGSNGPLAKNENFKKFLKMAKISKKVKIQFQMIIYVKWNLFHGFYAQNKRISVKYYLDNIFFLQHLNVPISKKFTDGSYGPNKPYIKIGIYRIGETGTTIFTYNNLKIKNKKL